MAKLTVNNLSNSGIDIEKIISKLVEVKSIPINELKDTNTLISKKIKLMQDFLAQLKEFQDLTKSLYDYRSPFDEKKGLSSNESILKVIASRNADIGKRNIKVLQIAKSERISSDLISSTEKIDKVSFTITSGDTTKKVIFNGGSILDFVNEIKKQAGDIVNISIVNKDKDNIYITIESKNEGIKNKLIFSEEAYPILEKLGFFIKSTKTDKIFSLNDFGILKDQNTTITNNNIILNKISTVVVDFQEKIKNFDNVKITFDINKTETKPQSGASVFSEEAIVEGINVENISVESDPLFTDKPAEPVIKGPLQIKVIGEKGEKIITIENPQKGFTIEKNNLNIGEITKIEILNTSNDQYKIENFKVEALKTKEGYEAKNILQNAQNSIIEIDGIRLEKSTNKIDDVIKGVTLELKKESNEEVQINIENNYDFIKEKIIEWVGKYNNIIKFIKEEMSTDKGEDGKVKGNFTGDITLMMLHNTLQKTMSNFYPAEGKINLLSQLGISTGKPGTIPQEKGGFLEIDEERLDKALRENIGDVKKFFGFDSDNDLLPDSGLGVRMYNVMFSMTDFGKGAIRQRIEYFTKTYEGNKKRIETLTTKLEDYRDNLIYKFSTMEQLVSTLKSQGQYLSNYFSSLQNTGKNQ
ncbi:MAG: flagellar filament capping protein FliD [Spirochaetes bacterium]|nr:flagellar filament capping protein FliD [Spirochaetota bacterium]